MSHLMILAMKIKLLIVLFLMFWNTNTISELSFNQSVKNGTVVNISEPPTPIVIEYPTNLTYSFGKNDCSSFIQTIYKTNFNIELPRTSLQMSKLGKTIPIYSIQVGDLLFYNRTSRGSPSNTISHVAIYLGNDSILHLVSAGVVIDNIDRKFYKNRLVRIKKLF